jgi:hypothetical protein
MCRCFKNNGLRFVISLLSVALLSFSSVSKGQMPHDTITVWHSLLKGISYWEPEAPQKSILNDSKLFILKVDPQLCNFRMLCSSEHKKQNRTADRWAEEFNVNVIVNAGMFSLKNGRTNKGYLKNYSHTNNPVLNGNYNVMMAMNPKKKSFPAMTMYDLSCNSWASIRTNYNSFCQGMRMIDCKGNPLAWDKRPGQACSMVISATDTAGNLYFIFTRSPYTHQTMIGFLIQLIPNVRTTVYLEGGPEASLYIQTNDTIISKIGSYVSKTYANDDNDHFWKIPNVIGIQSEK